MPEGKRNSSTTARVPRTQERHSQQGGRGWVCTAQALAYRNRQCRPDEKGN